MNFEHFEGASVGYQKSNKRKNWNGWKRNSDENKGQKEKMEVKLFDTCLVFKRAWPVMFYIVQMSTE